MPIYTYQCENCGVQFDQQQSFSDQPLVRCPECGKKRLKKVFQPVGIVFKGSGFYATDHHSPSGQGKKVEGKPENYSSQGEPISKTEKVTDKDSGKVSGKN